jgi:hypothetical protein
MPYDDDDDLFGHEFDFVDDDEDEGEKGEKSAKDDKDEPAPKPRRRPAARGKADKPAAERPKGRGKAPAPGARRTTRPPAEEAAEPEREVPPPIDDEPIEEEVAQEQSAPEHVGPPADHVVHIYEYGQLKRTIPRKFTDEEAVSFAEEYTRTSKAYGRYAVATPEDEEPAPTFAGASRGN